MRGFTLIELLAVVLIIGVLSTIAIPQYRQSLERSRIAEAQEMLPAIYDSWERYVVEQQQSTMSPLSTFSLLDISMKGKSENNKWRTANFEYQMVREGGTSYTTAESRRGKYVGTMILYDGENFVCINSNEHPGGCDVFNMKTVYGYYAY
jgi:prepilin-type N-terminal cleavage/methylation domain-containing protein